MCGIAGEVRRSGPGRAEQVDRQLRTLDHRGPDSTGIHARGQAAIGQNRLAVVDLVTGDPPIAVCGGDVAVAFNGEIYDFRALRERLLAEGHTFTSSGDTEVIAHLAEHLEPAALASALDGMFAFAVWDSRRERLVLGRDRFGKKPLYVWQGDDVLVFGSEIKAVLAHDAVPRTLDPDAIPAYLHLGYVPSPGTFFEGVRSVPPGHVLVVEQGLHVRLERYWAPPLPGVDGTTTLDIGPAEAATETRRLLDAAVRRRLVADVPLGAFLSGGVDSSAIAALMAEATTGPVKTFTIGFAGDAAFDERAWAAKVAARIGSEHTEFVVEPAAVDLVEQLTWHFDQPFADSSAVPTYLLSQLTRQHVTVALCGDGGDELFAGYQRFAAGVAVGRAGALVRPAGRLAALAAPRVGGRTAGKLRRFAASAGLGLPDAYREWVAYLPLDRVRALVPGGPDAGTADYEAHWRSTEGAKVLDRLLHLNLTTYLLDDLLPKVDRTSMAHALEVRAPFLDRELAELALRLPPGLKLSRRGLKVVLKDAVADLLPEGVADRPKMGFGVPLDAWFRGELAAFVADRLGPAARVRQHVRGAAIDGLLAEQASGAGDHGAALWSLLGLELFLQREGW